MGMSVLFLKRLGEEALYAAVAGFATAALTGELDKAGMTVALMAATRGVLGVLAKNFGSDKDKPSMGA